MENSINSFALRVTAARYDYEFLSLSAEDIAAKYKLPLASLLQEIQDQFWTQCNTASTTTDLTNSNSSLQVPSSAAPESTGLIDETRKRIDVQEAYRIREILPYCIATQKKILEQTYLLVQTLPEDMAPRAKIQTLKTAHEITDAILSKVPTVFTPKDGETPPVLPNIYIQTNIQ